ncbi:MAG: DUF4386 domain-containing protein [Chitinophagaceae bacterium]
MSSEKQTARLAGLIYLVVVLTGMFSLAYVPSKLIVWEDAEKTFRNLSSETQLFRWGIASSLLCYLAFLLLPLVLYRVLQPVNETRAKLMVIFALVSVPISFLNLQHKFAVLDIINGTSYIKGMDSTQLQLLVMQHLEAYDSGILVVQLFWGLWLLPFGALVYRSGFLPKVLGVLLMLGCFGYLVNVFGRTIIPHFDASSIAKFIRLPASLGEIGTCLWLLIFSVRKKQ